MREKIYFIGYTDSTCQAYSQIITCYFYVNDLELDNLRVIKYADSDTSFYKAFNKRSGSVD